MLVSGMEVISDSSFPKATENFQILTQRLLAVEALAKAAWNLRRFFFIGQIRFGWEFFLGGGKDLTVPKNPKKQVGI